MDPAGQLAQLCMPLLEVLDRLLEQGDAVVSAASFAAGWISSLQLRFGSAPMKSVAG
jgi:hypothetical protein